MRICAANKKVNPENYDIVVYLGLPLSELESDDKLKSNEYVCNTKEGLCLKEVPIWVSLNGINKHGKPVLDGYPESNYIKRHQIILNQRETNFRYETQEGYDIYKVGKGTHYEIEI